MFDTVQTVLERAAMLLLASGISTMSLIQTAVALSVLLASAAQYIQAATN